MTMMMDEVFEGARVPGWLRRFEADPDAALADLLLGCADLGMLQAEEPTEILLDWLDGLGDKSDFRTAVDAALARWIDTSRRQTILPNAAGSATLTAIAWCRAADLIAFDRQLPQSAARLREFATDGRNAMDVMTQSRPRDPLGRALLATARYQEDRSLIDLWWQVCSLPPGERWYRGGYGIEGLRGLPNSGGFPGEVAEGLVVLAMALHRHMAQGWLGKEDASREFHRVAKSTVAAYPFPELWLAFWRETVQFGRGEAVREWIEKLGSLDEPVAKTRRDPQTRSRRVQPDRRWRDRANRIAERLKTSQSAIGEAESLLQEEARYADATGDGYDIVRSACRFAARVGESECRRALSWLSLARRYEPWNVYVWNTAVMTLLRLWQLPAALRLALETVERFPDDVYARTELAQVLKAQERFEEAEEVYRDTVERFPDDVVARNGLAEVLKLQGRLVEAEEVYRDTAGRFLDDDDNVSPNGLAAVLKAQGRLKEAEELYRDTAGRFPNDDVSPNGLAGVLKAQGRLKEAEELYRDTAGRFPNDHVSRNELAWILLGWSRFEEAERLFRETQERFHDPVSREGLRRTLEELGRSDETSAQLDTQPTDKTTCASSDLAAPQDVAIDEFTAEWFDEPDDSAYAHTEIEEAAGKAPLQSQRPVTTADQEDGATPSIAESPLPRAESAPEGPSSDACAGRAEAAGKIPTESNRRAAEPGRADEGSPTHAEATHHRREGTSEGLRSEDIEVVLADAYLLRRWGRLVTNRRTDLAPRVQDRARELLERLATFIKDDARAASEQGLLALDEGQWEEALALLREAARRFSGSARVKYALARAERVAARQRGLRWSRDAESQVLSPWRELHRVGEHFRFVQWLGEGRSLLALADGSAVQERACNSFGKLAHWIRRQIVDVPHAVDDESGGALDDGEDRLAAVRRSFAPVEGTDPFFAWWACEVQTYVFGREKYEKAEDIHNVSQVVENVNRSAAVLDRIEEEYVFRFARV